MHCGEWTNCGHFEGDGCRGRQIAISVEGGVYVAEYWGNGEWDSRNAILLLDLLGDSADVHVQPHNLSYLATMDTGEISELAEIALDNLRSGWWMGLSARDGADEPSHLAAKTFARRYSDGDRTLNEGFVREYGNDLAGELRFMRGWCIHKADNQFPQETEFRGWVPSLARLA